MNKSGTSAGGDCSAQGVTSLKNLPFPTYPSQSTHPMSHGSCSIDSSLDERPKPGTFPPIREGQIIFQLSSRPLPSTNSENMVTAPSNCRYSTPIEVELVRTCDFTVCHSQVAVPTPKL
jgi:hypothetical protein